MAKTATAQKSASAKSGNRTPADRRTVTPTPEAEKSAAAKANSAADTAKKRVAQEASKAQNTAADHAEDSADQIKEAGDAFDSGSWAQEATHRIADNLSEAAQSMRNADFAAIQDDVTDFARRQPLVFFGGAALLGFAAARMLKASDRAEHDSHVADHSDHGTWGRL